MLTFDAKVKPLTGAVILIRSSGMTMVKDAMVQKKSHGRRILWMNCMRSIVATTAFCLFSLSSLSLAQVPSSNTCYPSDYIRSSSPCDASTQTRIVSYSKIRNCEDPYPVQQQHNEPCDCTPEDYFPVFKREDENGGKCSIFYQPRDCVGGKESVRVPVDEIYCDLQSTACKEEDIRTIYADCSIVSDPISGAVILNEPRVEVLYYFDSTCNPDANGTVPLPPSLFIPCDTKCGVGAFLSRGICKSCPAGTFSIGGGFRFDSFTSDDLEKLSNVCKYKNATGIHECDGWYVEDGALKVGAFDGPNRWFDEECSSDPSYDCHNNLKATLKMNIKLVRDGFVRFKYTVSAEKGFDGLSFYVDSMENPLMTIQSYAFHPQQVVLPISEGYHQLIWEYSKDAKWTQGQDTAAITFIEVDGTAFNDHSCLKCPPGFFSKEGAGECTPCPINHFSGAAAAECIPCNETTYSLLEPRTTCLPRPICNITKDATVKYSPCNFGINTRRKIWMWLEPHICLPDDNHNLPFEETQPCMLCPSGQFASHEEGTSNRICQFCPSGTARNAMNLTADAGCTPCEDGTVAVKQLSLTHFDLSNGTLPSVFLTGCSGDCGTNGWRVVNNEIDSGSGHGKSVSVWLSLNVTMEMEGDATFNFSADVPPGDMQRGLFFYINDNLVDDVEDGGYDGSSVSKEPMLSGPWHLSKGTHVLMWVWVKLNADLSQATSDASVIHSITVRGAAEGGATSCESVPEGAVGNADKSSWTDCPPGTYSQGGNSSCIKCPLNTFNDNYKQGEWGCLSCGSGTTSLEGSTECSIGEVLMPSSFCTFTPPITEGQGNETFLLFDLSPLSRLHAGSMFGPIYEDPTSATRDSGPTYFVSICNRDLTNQTCFDFSGRPLNTSACRVNSHGALESGKKPAHALGNRISLSSMRELDERLERRGFVMTMAGDKCPFTETDRMTNITFICDPDAGYGMPEAWTDQGKLAAFNPDLTYPDYILRTGKIIPVGNDKTCTYDMVWYSLYACPMCMYTDYEMLPVSNCVDNKFFTYKYKQPQLCQPNPQMPLPADIECQPCAETDIVKFADTCTDSKGFHNITFRWRQPKSCNDKLAGSVRLHNDIVVGPCVQEIFFIPPQYLSPQYIFLFALGGVLIVVLIIVSIVTWIKNRRVYNIYSKMVEEEQAAELDDVSDDDGEESGGGAGEDGSRLVSDKNTRDNSQV